MIAFQFDIEKLENVLELKMFEQVEQAEQAEQAKREKQAKQVEILKYWNIEILKRNDEYTDFAHIFGIFMQKRRFRNAKVLWIGKWNEWTDMSTE